MTVVLGRPFELEQWLDRRKRLGQDRHDEVWQGEYHMVPGPSGEHSFVDLELGAVLRSLARAAGLFTGSAFNLGQKDDYRVPDAGVHREPPRGTYLGTAAAVVEIVSPDDETFAKFDFFAAHDVEEVFVADPARRTVRVWQRRAAGAAPYVETGVSDLLGVTAGELADEITWP